MRAAFASVLQSCDQLQHSDVVTRFCIAEAGTSITSLLNHISSFTTGHLSRNIFFSIVRITSVSSPKCLFRRHVSSYISFLKGKACPSGGYVFINHCQHLFNYFGASILMACLCSWSTISLETPSTYHKTRRMVLQFIGNNISKFL